MFTHFTTFPNATEPKYVIKKITESYMTDSRALI